MSQLPASNLDAIKVTRRTVVGPQPDNSTPTGSTPVGSVTNAQLAPMPANTVKANPTGSSASATDVAAAASTILARLATGNIVWATVVQLMALTGWAWANSQLATMTANTLKGNNTSGSATPVDLTVAQSVAMLGVNPTTTIGDVIFTSATSTPGTLSRLPRPSDSLTTTYNYLYNCTKTGTPNWAKDVTVRQMTVSESSPGAGDGALIVNAGTQFNQGIQVPAILNNSYAAPSINQIQNNTTAYSSTKGLAFNIPASVGGNITQFRVVGFYTTNAVAGLKVRLHSLGAITDVLYGIKVYNPAGVLASAALNLLTFDTDVSVTGSTAYTVEVEGSYSDLGNGSQLQLQFTQAVATAVNTIQSMHSVALPNGIGTLV